MKFTEQQVRRYVEDRFRGQRIGSGVEIKVRCPFHDDHTPSLGFNMNKAAWICHAGCGHGGILDFEEKFSRCDHETARSNIAKIIGNTDILHSYQKPEAIYEYRDALSRVAFEKLRYAGKRFVQRKPTAKGGHEYKLGDVKKPLYRLPEVLTANEILVCEGEKDCDNVLAAFAKQKLADGIRIAATTNFDGAGKWRDEYALFFAGKRAVILPD